MLNGLKRAGKWINGTTQRRLVIWSIGFWVILVSILNFAVLSVGENQMLGDNRQNNLRMASSISREVNAEINGIIGNSRVFVQHLEILGPSLDAQANAALGLRLSSPEYHGVYYYDKNGSLLFSLTDTTQNLLNMRNTEEIITHPALQVKDEIKNALTSSQGTGLFVSDVSYTPPDYNPVIDLAIPVAFSTGETRAIILEIDMSAIWQKIDMTTIGQTGICFAVSKKGIIIAHPDPAYIGRQISVEISQVLASYEGFVEYTEPFKNVDVIASYSPVGGPTGWGIVVEQEKAEAYSTINKTGDLIKIIWLVLGLVGTISIFLLTNSFTKPIKELTRTARNIAQTGKMAKTGLERRSDEVGQLSQAFDQMIEKVNQAQKAEEEATIAERTRLARELHDAVSQTLFSASLIAEVLPRLWERDQDEGHRRLEELRQLTKGALAEMRALLFELRPAALEDVSLSDLLKQLSQAVTGRARIPVSLEVSGDCEIKVDAKVALYRICQEALNNVAKHSKATRADIVMICSGEQIKLRISDNGQGFNFETARPGSLGLGIMNERAKSIGASLTINSQIGKGTIVEVLWDGHLNKEAV